MTPFSPTFKSTWRSRSRLLLGMAAMVTAVGTMLIAGRPPASVWLGIWALFGAGSLLVLGALGSASRKQILVFVLFLRLLAFLTTPHLSDDLFRYVHEARATRMGLATPYTVAPADLNPPPAPDDGLSARVNHPDISAAYPPFSQLLLAGVIAIGDALGAPLLSWRLAMIAVDVWVVLLLFGLGPRRHRWVFAWYGLHPLPLLEACVGAHLDAVGMLLVALALLLATRPLWWGFAIGLACGIKPIAVLALSGLPMRWTSLAIALTGITLGIALPTAPYLWEEVPLWRGLAQYSARWEASPTGYAVVETVVGAPLRRAATEERWTHIRRSASGVQVDTAGQVRLSFGAPAPPYQSLPIDQRVTGRLAVLGLLFAVIGLLLLKRRDRLSRATWAFSALWWLTPTLHPWYLLWLLPLACRVRSKALWCWAATVPLSYEAALRYQETGIWQEALWPRLTALCALGVGAFFDLRPDGIARARRWLARLLGG